MERGQPESRDAECDAGEFNLCGYYMARDRGHPYIGLPIFLHRRFRHGFIFINTSKGISKPTDLIGRKVGTKGYLFTAGLWMRGIIEHDYGVPHKSIEWLSELDEDVDFTRPPGLKITPPAFGRDRRMPLTNRYAADGQAPAKAAVRKSRR